VSLELVIVTPDGEVFRGPVEAVLLPGSEGDFMVLEGHERLLSSLRIGEVEIRRPGAPLLFAALSEGFAEVTNSEVVVTAEACELASDIDVARAERARERAERELAAAQQVQHEEAVVRVARASVQRAMVRIAVAKRT
jgi:F-type H+-transporting ATPase subunit epsilon